MTMACTMCTRRYCLQFAAKRGMTAMSLKSYGSTLAQESIHDEVEDYYQNAKPLKTIPGPKGLPFLGTLLQYRNGKFPFKFNLTISRAL